MISKKGQGLSINVIIVATLALIVLVVLAVIFTTRAGIFDRGVSKEGNEELVSFRSLKYGDCHPTLGKEQSFLTMFNKAESADDEETAKADFEREIDGCKIANSKTSCEGTTGCRWK